MYSSATASYSASAVCAAKLLLHGRDSAIKEEMSAQGFIRTGLIRGDKLRQPFASCQIFPNVRFAILSAIEILDVLFSCCYWPLCFSLAFSPASALRKS